MHTGFLVGKHEGNRQPEKSKRRWEDNIGTDLQETMRGNNSVDLAQNRENWRVFVNEVMNLLFT